MLIRREAAADIPAVRRVHAAAFADPAAPEREPAGEPLVVLLGHRDYYPRFGFRPAVEYGVEAPDPAWGAHFQVRALAAYTPDVRGAFTYAAPFADL